MYDTCTGTHPNLLKVEAVKDLKKHTNKFAHVMYGQATLHRLLITAV
jgi:hypothetical protein